MVCCADVRPCLSACLQEVTEHACLQVKTDDVVTVGQLVGVLRTGEGMLWRLVSFAKCLAITMGLS